MRSGLSIVDILTSLYAAIAILAALAHRNSSTEGVGQYIDLALLDSMVATLSHRGMQYLISGKAAARKGNVGAGGAPSGAFRCADGQIVLTVGNDSQWRRFCDAVRLPQLRDDVRFATASRRIENREALTPIIAAAFATQTKAEWLSALEAADIPSGPVNELPEVFADEHVLERGMLGSVEHPLLGIMPYIANPIRFSRTPLDRYRAPPMLGEHTESVLREFLGASDQEIAELRSQKVI